MSITRILAAARRMNPDPAAESVPVADIRAAQDEAREWRRRALMAEFRIEEAHKDRDFWRAEARASDNAAAIRRQALRSLLDAAEREAASLRIQIDHERSVSQRLARLLGAATLQDETLPPLRLVSGGER